MSSTKMLSAIVDYEDPYVQPLILSALKSQFHRSSFVLIEEQDYSGRTDAEDPILQWRSYESINFELGVGSSQSLFNAYIIRKALIRKHFLAHTVSSWVTKHPSSALQDHVKYAVDFELDYAEFLDEALIEAYELHDSFQRNADKPASECEWWILKPSMSDRGQGIRLFSSEAELRSIFEEWEADNPDLDSSSAGSADNDGDDDNDNAQRGDGIMTSQLRHFIAQPYIHPPLLLPAAPYSNRKFHIRTYVVAAGALRVYIYKHMLALFATNAYAPPWATAADELAATHLTNTCVQPASEASSASPVHLLSSLPLPHQDIQAQIGGAVSELFRAAVALPTHFQPLPQSFEIFGVDFLLDADGRVWLLEVNAFPDFAQTGDQDNLKELVVGGLMRDIVREVVGPKFGIKLEGQKQVMLELVLDVDLRRD